MTRTAAPWGACLTMLLALGVATLATRPASAGPAPPGLDAAAFGHLPYQRGPEVSPDGRYAAAMVLRKSGRYGVVIYDLDAIGTKAPTVVDTADDQDVNWLHWKRGNRLLVSVRFPSRRWGVATVETRLFSLNADGSGLKLLVRPKNEHDVLQIADDVQDFLPADPERILMSWNLDDPRRPRLYRVNVLTDRHEQLEPGSASIQLWHADGQGRVRLAEGRNVTEGDSPWQVLRRADEKAPWSLLWDSSTAKHGFDVLGFDPADPEVLDVLSDHEGETLGLYSYRLGDGSFSAARFRHPDVDVDSVIRSPADGRIQGVIYVTDYTRVEWFDPGMAALDREIRAALPGWQVAIASRSDDNRRVMVRADATDHSGRYYLYEPATRKLRYFAYEHGELDKFDLARMAPVSYKARDGLQIPGYLTLPSGVRNPPEKPLPTVIMPHGGPEARDYAEFQPDVQMLANRGYAVLQMNFRGSAGYGAEFQMAGRREWGEAMQDDITDGTRWLIESGIADPARICIVGGSYGGYAALMGPIREPGLYRCAVSLNGVSDLVDFINSRRFYVGARDGWVRRIGETWADREKLTRNSPARRAADIGVPVLLVHGDKDRTVPPEQSRQMASALKGAGKDYRYVELEGDDHYLSRDVTRVQYFQELDTFLARHLR